MKKLFMVLIVISISLTGCFSKSIQTSTRYNTESEFMTAYEKTSKDDGFYLFKFNTHDSISFPYIKKNNQGKLVGVTYNLSHGPYEGSYSFSSEYDLSMDYMSLFNKDVELVDEMFVNDLIIRSREEIIASEHNYHVSFSYINDEITYFGNIYFIKSNPDYELLTIEAIKDKIIEFHNDLKET